jgi:hypothetical protein
MTHDQKIQDALNIVQNNLSLFDPEEAETLQHAIDLWVYAPRMLALLKSYLDVEKPVEILKCHRINLELMAAIEK